MSNFLTNMNSNHLQILLVEDDDIDAMAVERALATTLFRPTIVRAKNGLDALELVSSVRNFFAILLDLNMPKMNGFEFLNEYQKITPSLDMNIFVLTTSDNRLDMQTCFDLGAQGYYLKDELFETSELIETLAELMSKNQKEVQ